MNIRKAHLNPDPFSEEAANVDRTEKTEKSDQATETEKFDQAKKTDQAENFSIIAAEEDFQRPKIRRVESQFGKSLSKKSESDRKPREKKSLVRKSNLSLSELTGIAQEILPLPREIQNKINKTHRNWFIAQLREADSEEKLTDFAYRLNYQQLSLLFPILATINKKSTAEKIKTIISLRMSKILYTHGWLTFQFIYPDNRFAKIMTSVCQDLAKTNFAFATESDYTNPIEQQEKNLLDYPHFNWSKIKPISEISLPDNRRFIDDIINYILDNQISLEDFFHSYGIYEDLALGQSIKSMYDVEKLERQISNIKGERKSWKELLGF